MQILIQEESFDPWLEMSEFQARLQPGKCGGSIAFVGTLRDYNEDREVFHMNLEHYPGMTERCIEKICHETMNLWDVIDVLVIHRYGRMEPNDPIVLVAVWAAHRSSAFESCRYIINELKTRAPFWKRESTPEGEVWVENNTEDVPLG